MRIIHVFRGAVGGLFRHVCDQVEGQAAAGHQLGIFCDSSTGGDYAAAKFAALAPICTLGIHRTPMKTLPGPSDLSGISQMTAMARDTKADILHGHGAKGGLYARLAAKRLGIASVYVPHGGSLHYEWKNPKGAVFLLAEKALRVKHSAMIFVCAFEREAYAQKVGLGGTPSTVIHNGLSLDDFKTRHLADDATDLLFVGEMRSIKGVDILLTAVAAIPATDRPSLTLVGDGPEEMEFKNLSQLLGLEQQVRFMGRKSMAVAMGMGRVLVVPSRRESFPYVVIEAMAAGIPLIASNAGGIGEALPASSLFPVGDIQALSAKLLYCKRSVAASNSDARDLQEVARHRFNSDRMVADTLAFYRQLN